MAKMILYKGGSQYGALRVHADQLANAFKILGHDPIVIDLTQLNCIMEMNKALSEGWEFVFSLMDNRCKSRRKISVQSIEYTIHYCVGRSSSLSSRAYKF